MTTTTRSTRTIDDPRSVCSLDDADLNARLALIRAEIAPRIVAREARPGVRLRFAADDETRARVEAWIALERTCCAGLAWVLETDGPDGQLRLDIHGLDPESPFFAALSPKRPEAPRAGFLARAGRAGGIGVVLSLLTFCGLPLLLATLFGGTVAGALAGLDDPLVITAGAVAMGLAAWSIGRWRASRRSRCAC